MTNGVRPSHVFVCLGEPMGNAALGQGSKQSEHADVDTPYLMDRPLRKHSLEQAAEKCLTHIGGMLLAGDVCKQQPSPSAVVGVQCEGPRRSVQDGCCAKKQACAAITVLEFPKALIELPERQKESFYFAVNHSQGAGGKRCVYHISEQLVTPMTRE